MKTLAKAQQTQSNFVFFQHQQHSFYFVMASTTCFCFVLSSTTWPLFCSGFNKMAFVLFWHHPLRVLSVYTARDSRQVECHQQHGFCFVLASTTKTTTRQGHISQVSITTRQGNEGTWGIVCNTSDSVECQLLIILMY